MYPVECRTWFQLLDELGGQPEEASRNLNPEGNWFLGKPKDTILQMDLAALKAKKEGFKLATFGTCTTPLFGDTDKICAK